MTFKLIPLILSYSFATTLAFPDGAPSIACGPMIPAGHFPSTVTGENPFALNISATSYKPGDIITGGVAASLQAVLQQLAKYWEEVYACTLYSPKGEQFRGFLIEFGTAQNTGVSEQGVGTFTDPIEISKYVCGSAGITHINKDEKDMVMFTWKAPSQSVGNLSIRATVVQEYFPSKYWQGIFSPRIVAQ